MASTTVNQIYNIADKTHQQLKSIDTTLGKIYAAEIKSNQDKKNDNDKKDKLRRRELLAEQRRSQDTVRKKREEKKKEKEENKKGILGILKDLLGGLLSKVGGLLQGLGGMIMAGMTTFVIPALSAALATAFATLTPLLLVAAKGAAIAAAGAAVVKTGKTVSENLQLDAGGTHTTEGGLDITLTDLEELSNQQRSWDNLGGLRYNDEEKKRNLELYRIGQDMVSKQDLEKDKNSNNEKIAELEESLKSANEKETKEINSIIQEFKATNKKIAEKQLKLSEKINSELDRLNVTDQQLLQIQVKAGRTEYTGQKGIEAPGLGNHMFNAWQEGGQIKQVPGHSTGDRHFAWQSPGDVVVNRNAAKALKFNEGGKVPTMVESGELLIPGNHPMASMGLMMNNMVPRFASGGVVEYITGQKGHSNYSADHDYGQYHEHIAFNSKEERDAADRYLAAKGFYIGSRNDGTHAPGSYHYKDQAFDVPFYPNHTRKGYSDDRSGTDQFSKDVRAALKEGGFDVTGASEGAHPGQDIGLPGVKGPTEGGLFGGMFGNMGKIMGNAGGMVGNVGVMLQSFMTGVLGEGGFANEIFGNMGNMFGVDGGSDWLSGLMGGEGSSVSSGPVEPLTGSEKEIATKMFNYLTKEKGLSRNKALGILANIKYESGFRTGVASGDDGGSGGLFQMKGGRGIALENAVPDWKTNWKGQIDHALETDRSPEYLSKTFSSGGEAANWFMRNWERPAEVHRDKRERDQTQWIEASGLQNGGVAQITGSPSTVTSKFNEAMGTFAKQVASSGGGSTTVIVRQKPTNKTQVSPTPSLYQTPPELPDGPSVPAASNYMFYDLNFGPVQ